MEDGRDRLLRSRTMDTIRAWVQAARPLAQANIAVPLLLGQAMAFALTGRLDLERAAWIHGFGLLAQLFIVFANDFADREGDAKNTTYNQFSGGSRVIPEGKLSAGALRTAAIVALSALSALALAALLLGHGPWLLAGTAATALLLWAYSFPPLRYAYRGGGEVLQGLGVGVVLPLVAFATQSGGDFASMRWLALAPMFVLGVAGNILTALPDHPADKAADKRSYPVSRGQWVARRHFLELTILAACATPLVLPTAPIAVMVAVAAPTIGIALSALPLLGSADAEQRDECRVFVLRGGAATAALQLCWALALVVLALVPMLR